MNIDTAYYRHRTCLRFILSFIVWLIPMLAHAQISPQKAERLAWDFLVSRFSDRPLPGLYRTDMPEEYGVHVFNIGEDNGFVLVSKSEGADIPVIGYSTSGRFDYSRMPPALKALLLTLKSNASETAPLLPGTYKTVAPILTTKWGQGKPYNQTIPQIDGQPTWTGCGATAMAQLVKYYRHPKRATGSVSYTTYTTNLHLEENLANITLDYDHLKDDYTLSYTAEEAIAVAELMRACGLAMKMDYGLDGSGAYIDDVKIALHRHFQYDCELIVKDDYWHPYDNEEWMSRIYEELQALRPILYLAQSADNGGHFFLLDGNDEAGMVHINWGWDGYCDGFFAFGAFNPDDEEISPDGFNFEHMMLVGIEPYDTFLPEDILTWSGTPSPTHFVGINGSAVLYAAHHFAPSELSLMGGNSIRSIEFAPGAEQGKYTLCIWRDKERKHLLMQQAVANFQPGIPNRIVLDEPFTIPFGEDLYIGYKVEDAQYGHPLGCDDGPANAGKGNLVGYNDQAFESLVNLVDVNYNFYIRAYTEKAEHITYTLKYEQPANGSLSIFTPEGTPVASNTTLRQGTILRIKVQPHENYQLNELTVNGESIPIEAYFSLDDNTTVAASMTPVAYTVTFDQPANGSLSLTANGQNISSGEELGYGTSITVVPLPDTGYEVDRVTVNGQELSQPYIFMLEAQSVVSALMKVKAGHCCAAPLAASYKVYPNPTTSGLTIEVPEEMVGQTARLCDLAGKVILSHRLQATTDCIHIGTVPVGTYLLRVGQFVLKVEKR